MQIELPLPNEVILMALPRQVETGLLDLATHQRRQTADVVRQALTTCLHGRLQFERSSASKVTYAPADRSGGTTVLIDQVCATGLATVASSTQLALPALVERVLAEHLFGTTHAPGDRSIQVLLHEDDSKVTASLPESVDVALKTLADLLEVSASDVARNCVFTHMYGRLAYERAVASGAWQPSRRFDGAMFSELPAGSGDSEKAPRTALIEQIGKADRTFTVYMPTMLKTALWTTAERAGYRVSEYLRRHLATYLLGRLTADALPLAASR